MAGDGREAMGSRDGGSALRLSASRPPIRTAGDNAEGLSGCWGSRPCAAGSRREPGFRGRPAPTPEGTNGDPERARPRRSRIAAGKLINQARIRLRQPSAARVGKLEGWRCQNSLKRSSPSHDLRSLPPGVHQARACVRPGLRGALRSPGTAPAVGRLGIPFESEYSETKYIYCRYIALAAPTRGGTRTRSAQGTNVLGLVFGPGGRRKVCSHRGDVPGTGSGASRIRCRSGRGPGVATAVVGRGGRGPGARSPRRPVKGSARLGTFRQAEIQGRG